MMVQQVAMPNYASPDYWEQRYAREPAIFDWYHGWQGLGPLLKKILPLDSRLLHIGCGTSRLQEHMVTQGGYCNIINTDISKVVVSHMGELHATLPQLSYRVSDVRNMPEYKDGQFDGVLDKGTLDALVCGNGANKSAAEMLKECCRVLRPGGKFVLITYGDPLARLPHLCSPDLEWRVDVYCMSKMAPTYGQQAAAVKEPPPVIQGPFSSAHEDTMDALSTLTGVHFVYVCIKDPSSRSSLDDIAAATDAPRRTSQHHM